MEKDIKRGVREKEPSKFNLKSALRLLFKTKKRTAVVSIVFLVLGVLILRSFFLGAPRLTYQTSLVTKDTLIVTLSESGTVAVANRMPVTTQASGVISEVFVKNGEVVEEGQKIASLTLDSVGLQQQASAYASYLSAQSNLNKANASMFSTQSTMFASWDTYTKIAQNSTFQNSDGSPNTSNRTLPQFTTVQDDWLAAEANYKNQQTVVLQMQAALTSAWSTFQQVSSDIVSPVSGVVSDLIVAPGMQMSNGSTSSGTTSSSNTNSSKNVASIKIDGKQVVTVNLSEADVIKVQSDEKATITFDALPNLTFTGKLLGVNTTGSVSSGVTTYPATIILDTGNDKILPNMAATATIITNIRPDVLLIPNAAIQSLNGQSTVRVMKNGKVTSVPVEVGLSSDTQTEIVSGLSEGEVVVTSISGGARSASSSSTSPFGAGLRGGFGGGGTRGVGTGGR